MISFVSYFYNIRFSPQGIDQTNLINGGESGILTHDTVSRIHTFQACAEFLTHQNQSSFNDKTLKIDLNCDQSETRFLYFFKYKVIWRRF